MEFKKPFLLFLTVLFCYDVGESELKLKPGYEPSYVLYKKCNLISGNEVIVLNNYNIYSTSFTLVKDPYWIGE